MTKGYFSSTNKVTCDTSTNQFLKILLIFTVKITYSLYTAFD